MRYAIIVGCVLAGALGTSCGDIHVVPADGGAGKTGGDGGPGGGGRGGGAAGNAAGTAGAGSAGTGASGTGGIAAGTGGRGDGGAAGTGGMTAGNGGAIGTGGAAGGRGGSVGTGGTTGGNGGAIGTGGVAGGRGGSTGTSGTSGGSGGASGRGGSGGRGGATGTGGAAGAGGQGGEGGAPCRRELLTNGEFDLGASSWSEAPLGTRLVRRSDDAEVAGHQITPQSGLYVLRLGAPSNNYVVHYVEQYANIPAGALELTISGHLQVRTDEPPDDIYDEASVQLFDEALPSSPFFRSAPRWSNLTQASSWTPFSFVVNVASVAGKQMVFRIIAELDTSVPTYFYFDTLSVAVTRCSP